MKTIRARAPLRLGLAGGGTDVSPFSDEHGGCVLNATIDLYAQAILEPLESGQAQFVAEDLQQQYLHEPGSAATRPAALPLHVGIYRRVMQQFNGGHELPLKMTTYADVPPGSGLGTSSTMVVCMLQAYNEWLQLGMGEYELAHLAFEIERVDLALAGGKQDQYAAAFGGFNFIEFGPGERVLVNPLRIKDWIVSELEASTVLFYTGQSRESASIIQRQIDNTRAGDARSMAASMALRQDAVAMKEAILRGDFAAYANVLGRSWLAKKQMASGISNAGIDEIYDAAITAGAIAGKISGAGGGGFMMFYVPPARRMGVVRVLGDFPGQVMNFNFTGVGAHSWVM